MRLFRTLLANVRDKSIFDFLIMAEYSGIVHFVGPRTIKKNRAPETDLIMY